MKVVMQHSELWDNISYSTAIQIPPSRGLTLFIPHNTASEPGRWPTLSPSFHLGDLAQTAHPVVRTTIQDELLLQSIADEPCSLLETLFKPTVICSQEAME